MSRRVSDALVCSVYAVYKLMYMKKGFVIAFTTPFECVTVDHVSDRRSHLQYGQRLLSSVTAFLLLASPDEHLVRFTKQHAN
jgi:hypothetical protein